MNVHRPAKSGRASRRLARPPRPDSTTASEDDITTTSGEEPDHAVYRTELARQPDRTWQLRVDGLLVAETGDVDEHQEPLDQDQAQAWARRQMGEGVRFLNGLFTEPSGFWVATSDSAQRAMAAYHRNQTQQDRGDDDGDDGRAVPL